MSDTTTPTHLSDTNEAQHMQHERRFAQIDREVAGVKTDVGVLQADVRTLAAGQVAMQQSQDRGFEDIKATLQAKNSEPPKIGMGMLISVVGLFLTAGVIGVGAFWAAIMLLAEPIKEDLSEHKERTHHGDVGAEVALLGQRSESQEEALKVAVQTLIDDNNEKYAFQAQRLDDFQEDFRELFEWRLKTAEALAAQEVHDKWHADDLEALKADLLEERAEWQDALHSHQEIGDHPYGVMQELSTSKGELTGAVEKISGMLDMLRERIEQIDRDGSRGTNLRLNRLSPQDNE